MQRLISQVTCWRDGDRLTIWLAEPLPAITWEITAVTCRYWPTYSWADNPWLCDGTGHQLSRTKYDRIRPCSLDELAFERSGPTTYVCHVPLAEGAAKHHTDRKLGRWALAILMGSPSLAIGQTFEVQPTVTLRHPPQLRLSYDWVLDGPGAVRGVARAPPGMSSRGIMLKQEANGINWTVDDSDIPPEYGHDMAVLRSSQKSLGLVLEAHPSIHSFPWDAPQNVSNRHVLRYLKRQPYCKAKTGLGLALEGILQKLQTYAARGDWHSAVLHQTPKQLWSHKNAITEYQVWVYYRLVLHQLNLFFPGRELDNSCRRLPVCAGHKETLEHIFWTCPVAQGCWQAVLSAWHGSDVRLNDVSQYAGNCLARTPPPMSRTLLQRLQRAFGDTVEEYIAQWKRIWWILCSVCISTLWIQRNRAVHEQQRLSLQGSVLEFSSNGLRQLRALSARERRTLHSRVQGIRLWQCIELLADTTAPSRASHHVVSHVQPPGNSTPALLIWLRTFQRSCSH